MAVEAITNVRTVASLGCEEKFHILYVSEITPHYIQGKRNCHFRGAMVGLSRSLMFFSYGIVFYYGGYLIVTMDLFYGNVFK